ncbi:DUF4197 domain-containing protein [Uliginosibacterium sp. H3]|uniref:DUF4197 domain-containing protein n=1 Tax=Uliginosibacterium silvisoli TaxID=3114758 RepID=A0ABU6K033_9RHOO|nr:DUF4197 domain-containing protein [Uliginosibacterium sp. H3]
MHLKRRVCILALLTAPLLAGAAGLLDSLSNADASSGLKQALEQGATQAVATLGTKDGFLASDLYRIKLPKNFKTAESMLRMMGQGQMLDDLDVAMNRAAESAVAEATPLLVGAVKQMSVQDAKGILTGGDDSVTQYFRSKTSAALTQKFLPVVRQQTSRLQIAEQYNTLAKQGAAMGLVKPEEASVESYVTNKALDALYLRIGEEEKAIRQNPAAAVGSIAKKVFGAMGGK